MFVVLNVCGLAWVCLPASRDNPSLHDQLRCCDLVSQVKSLFTAACRVCMLTMGTSNPTKGGGVGMQTSL